MNDEMLTLPPELKEDIIDLAVKMSNLCSEHHPTAVLFVLEAGLMQEIENLSPTLGRMFAEMLTAYKEKARMLLQITDALTSNTPPIE